MGPLVLDAAANEFDCRLTEKHFFVAPTPRG
jgi:hypothetical protein